MERESRKEITLERANEIAGEIERLETVMEKTAQSTRVKIYFFNETNAIKYRTQDISVEFAEQYIKDLGKRLDQLKEERKNSILIDW